jgi:hypothetical protein
MTTTRSWWPDATPAGASGRPPASSGSWPAICVTCVEFVNMMVQAGRLQDAALMLGHLDKTAPYWAPQVAEARSTIAAARLAPDQEQGGLDDHQALEFMRRILDQLAGDRSQA